MMTQRSRTPGCFKSATFFARLGPAETTIAGKPLQQPRNSRMPSPPAYCFRFARMFRAVASICTSVVCIDSLVAATYLVKVEVNVVADSPSRALLGGCSTYCTPCATKGSCPRSCTDRAEPSSASVKTIRLLVPIQRQSTRSSTVRSNRRSGSKTSTAPFTPMRRQISRT